MTEPGLSPRVRGNPAKAASYRSAVRSIPACAGEPPLSVSVSVSFRVYPRVCGGTITADRLTLDARGLSPRVRGNHHCGQVDAGRQGSIPACAGEPLLRGRVSTARRVYPRVCGGTRNASGDAPAGCGLSPRVRGNRRPGQILACSPGSIPACAGEPHNSGRRARESTVYPRGYCQHNVPLDFCCHFPHTDASEYSNTAALLV